MSSHDPSPTTPILGGDPEVKTKIAVVTVSGGVDSAAVLFYAHNQGYKVHPLFLDYGHNTRDLEHDAAEYTVWAARKSGWDVAELTSRNLPLQEVARSPVMSGAQDDKPVSSEQVIHIPGRNIYIITAAAAFALEVDATRVFVGFHAWPDSHGKQFGDQSAEFLAAMNILLATALEPRVDQQIPQVVAPYQSLYKTDTITAALAGGFALPNLWICYQPTTESKPCNECNACVGFLEAAVDLDLP